ncbi:MAG: restriction endonuclease subunit S [Bacteroidales bacterium]|nr:restriction endonuclease subunit S [Bacteroidales bacterium]
MRTAKLKNITLTITDGKHGDCKNHDGSGYYFISCKDVYDETIHYENARQITEDDFRDADRRTNLAAYDILITNSGTIGRMALVKDIPETRKTTFQKSVAIVRADTSQVVPNYLYYLLKSKVHDFINSSNGSAQKNLLLSTMRDFDISFVDSFETQHRIATILSRYDSLIENYQKQIKLLEEAAQRLYKEWFVDLRFPGHENTKIVDGLPEGWEKKKVDSIYNIKYGKNLSTKLITDTGLYPVYGANGVIGYYDKANCNEQVVLITSRGNGSGDVLKTYHKDAFITNNSFIVTPLEGFEYCKLPFTFQFLTMANFRAVRTGAAQPQLTNQSIHTVDVVLPDEKLIEKFCSATIGMNDTIIKYREQLRLLTEARDRLLPKLMSGEITV